ncbi:Na(+)/H(+) antiporter subunit B [Puniceicoccales bacterium CK1056]|uniref:Na(+)/H(+) antiporter subunit B n=1 Tax=Oceanipulchritudo coccoides TaxID=2706888 RepID=A0A6B2M3K2_9BACT|nr:MnhB domain-containing protein [Oceanipulchritudo coccoides]NDV63538.1 Na(+)/H(+) antiporter subunit B [Oceanipulchritudo coccoides]
MLKPDSFILRKSATLIGLIVQIFAVYLFFRGHNLPGGGFIAGVASAIGILILIFANGSAIITRLCPFDPIRLCAWGLAIATLAGLAGLAFSGSFLTHYHYKDPDFPLLGSLYLGTPLLFDLGVFLVVLGVILKVTLVLMDALQMQKQSGEAAFLIARGCDDTILEDSDFNKEENNHS